MFGLRRRIERIASDLYVERLARLNDRAYYQQGVDCLKEKNEKLEIQVAKLTHALEWHVGASLEVINLEEKLIMLRVVEAKERGETFSGQGDEVARDTCDAINQSVEQKLNNEVSADTKNG